MATTKENEMTNRTILSQAGLSPELIDKMEAAKDASSEPCLLCGAGAGRWCADRVPNIKDPTWKGYRKTFDEAIVAPPNAKNVTPR
jgi:hypothetical protein